MSSISTFCPGPSCGFTDNFNRTAEDPLSDGGEWTVATTHQGANMKTNGTLAILENEDDSDYAVSSAIREVDGGAAVADGYLQVTLSWSGLSPSTNTGTRYFLRNDGNQGSQNPTGDSYMVSVNTDSGDGRIWRILAGAFTVIDGPAGALGQGVMKFDGTGTAITFTKDGGGYLSAVDANIANGEWAGFQGDLWNGASGVGDYLSWEDCSFVCT